MTHTFNVLIMIQCIATVPHDTLQYPLKFYKTIELCLISMRTYFLLNELQLAVGIACWLSLQELQGKRGKKVRG